MPMSFLFTFVSKACLNAQKRMAKPFPWIFAPVIVIVSVPGIVLLVSDRTTRNQVRAHGISAPERLAVLRTQIDHTSIPS